MFTFELGTISNIFSFFNDSIENEKKKTEKGVQVAV